jgi:hypothetical protein
MSFLSILRILTDYKQYTYYRDPFCIPELISVLDVNAQRIIKIYMQVEKELVIGHSVK